MITLTDDDAARIRAAADEGSGPVAQLYGVLRRRAWQWCETPGITSSGGSMRWWHVAWERLADVAAAYRLDPDPALGQWVHREVMAICRRPIDDWIGPEFRERTDPPRGMLETAHVGLGVATAISLCPELFSVADHALVREALKEKCQVLCHRALDHLAAPGRKLSNWYMTMLDGHGTVSVVLDDPAGVAQAADMFSVATGLYEDDSYGEGLQYWNYASSHLAHLFDVLVDYDPSLAAKLDLASYTRCIPWAVHSLMYVKPLAGWGAAPYPRSLNFGDSTAMFRPSADLLLHVATRAKTDFPTEAGLARWLFDTTFAHLQEESSEGDGFGFFNTFRWSSLVLLLEAADAISPSQADLPLTQSFKAGTVSVRDRWASRATVIGMQVGSGRLATNSHRHADYNSFVLAHNGERFFADPGHCCYRLETQRISGATRSHSTWTFALDGLDGTDQRLEQAWHGPSFEPVQETPVIEQRDDVVLVRADAAPAYGQPLTTAERTWISVLPHVVFVVDRIIAAEPVTVHSHFVLNNRDGALQVNEATDTRLVLRRPAAAAKFFQIGSVSGGQAQGGTRRRSWGFVHDVYHPEPNQRGQGREGSAVIYTYESPMASIAHLNVYAIVMDAGPEIARWHVDGSLNSGFTVSHGSTDRVILNVSTTESATVDSVKVLR